MTCLMMPRLKSKARGHLNDTAIDADVNADTASLSTATSSWDFPELEDIDGTATEIVPA